MTLGEKIKLLREEAGMTQMQLASRVSVPRLVISLWEFDEDVPDFDQIAGLSRFFGVPIDYLVSENNEIYSNLSIYDDAQEIIKDFDREVRKGRARKTVKSAGTLLFALGVCSVLALWAASSAYPVDYILAKPSPQGGGLPSEVTYTGARAFLLEYDLVAAFIILCAAGIAGVIMSGRKAAMVIVAAAVAAVSVLLYIEEPYIQYIHPTVHSLDYLYEPVQIATTGGTSLRVGSADVEIEYVAEYIISGRVLGYKDYDGDKIQEKLIPRDVAIAWGWLSDEAVDDKFQWGPFGERSFGYKLTNAVWIFQHGGLDAVRTSLSNNHLIPDGDRTRQLIRDIREGDFIKIEGYLVNATYPTGKNSYSIWTSDTARNNDDCELILVTDITWLQKPG